MNKVPELPKAPPKSVDDVLSYARVIENFANNNARQVSGELSVEMAGHLDVYANHLYGHQKVIVSGLHRVFSPVEDIFSTDIQLVNGIHEGDSNGFAVFDIDTWEPSLEDDSDQDLLYSQLKSRHPGKFAVAHVVVNHGRTISSRDYGFITQQQFNVIAPLRTNDFAVPDLLEIDSSASYSEAKAVIAALDIKSRTNIKEAISELQGDDPLRAIVRASKPLNTALAHNREPYQLTAIAEMLSHYVPKKLFRTVYQSDRLPPVYYSSDNGELDIHNIELPFRQIAFEQLYFLDRFFISNDGDLITPRESPPGIFLSATAAIDPWGKTLKFHVPVEHLDLSSSNIYAVS